MSEQHVQLPIKTDPISPSDKLIYCALKKYGEKSFPSIRTVANYLHIGVDKVRDSISNLVANDYIKVHKEGRKNVYTFNPYKKFEIFSYDFLDKEDLPFELKAYLVSVQQFMFKNDGVGKISYSDSEIAEKIGLTQSTVSRYNQSLINRGLLTVLKCQSEKGNGTVKLFDLLALGQAILFHQVAKNTEDISQIKQELSDTKKTLKLALQKINELEQNQKYHSFVIPE